MFFSKRTVDKIVTLRIRVGEQAFNQSINMALSNYGLNLKDLKSNLDDIIINLPPNFYCYFYFIIFKNGSYDIFLKGPTLASCVTQALLNFDVLEEYKISFEEIVLFHKIKFFFDQQLIVTLFTFDPESLYTQYKQVLGTISSFKTT